MMFHQSIIVSLEKSRNNFFGLNSVRGKRKYIFPSGFEKLFQFGYYNVSITIVQSVKLKYFILYTESVWFTCISPKHSKLIYLICKFLIALHVHVVSTVTVYSYFEKPCWKKCM